VENTIPLRINIAPNISKKVGLSLRNAQAKKLEPTGSPNKAIATEVAGKNPNAQFKVVCPII
jgi:hypothetical protein